MNTEKRKQLIHDYKQKRSVGAVYALECSGNHRRWIKSTTDIAGLKNRFQFSMSMKGCPDPVTRVECATYGWDSISLVVLEELEKKEDQTDKEFAEDIKVLKALWVDKLASEEKGAK